MFKNLNKVKDNNWVFALVFILLALVTYSSVVNGEFFFDDEHFIQKNEYVKNFDISEIYTSSVTEGAGIDGNFYRPNQQLIYAVLYRLWGENPVPFHLTSIIIHGLNAFVLFLLIRLLINKGVFIPFFASMIFLVHPVQTEAVAYISGLADPLVTFFVLSALYVLVYNIKTSRSNWGHFLIFIIINVLAIFTKENNVVLAPLVLVMMVYCYFVWGEKRPNDSAIAMALVSIVLAGSYVYLKLSVLNFTGAGGLTDQDNIYTQDFFTRVTTFYNVFPNYIKLYFAPVDLHYEKPYTGYTELFTRRTVLAFLYDTLWILSIWKIRKWPVVFLGLTVFSVAMIPYTGIIPLNAMYLEHWMYLPIIGWAIITAHFIGKIAKNKLIQGTIGVLVITMVFLSNSRAGEWGDTEKFYLNELKYQKSARVYTNLAMYYSDKKKYNKAVQYYKKSIALYDAIPQPHHNLGNLYWEMNMPEQAYNEWHKALVINPDFVYTWSKLYSITAGKNEELNAAIYSIMVAVQNGNSIPLDNVNNIFEYLSKSSVITNDTTITN